MIIYSPWQENSFTAKKKAAKGAPPLLPKEQFRWDAEHRQYICPQGHFLNYAGKASKQKNNGESVPLEVYRADPADCASCPLRSQCVQSQSGARSVRRRPHEEHVEALKERMKSPEAKAACIDSEARASSGRLRTRRSTAVFGNSRDVAKSVRQFRPAYQSWSTTCGHLINFAQLVMRSPPMPRKMPPERRNLSPEGENNDEIWSQWVPEIVVEVVSPSSRHRDYQEKPEEYLRLGVGEYWIVDADEGLMKVLRRSRGRWVEYPVLPPAGYRTRLLPGFEFSIEAVLQAAGGS